MSEIIFFVCLVTTAWLVTRSFLPMSVNVVWQEFGGAILSKFKLNQTRDQSNFFYIPPSGTEPLWFKPKVSSVVKLVVLTLFFGIAAAKGLVLRGNAAHVAVFAIFALVWACRTMYLVLRVSWLSKGDRWSIAESVAYQIFFLVDGIVVGVVMYAFLPDVGII